MQKFKKLHHLPPLLLITSFLMTICVAQSTPASLCGKIQIRAPFFNPNSTVSSPLSRMLVCKSQKLYFRTSLGLFSISSIDYATKTVTISHPSSSRQYVSPSLLSAGFPPPPGPNSLLLFNCSNKRHPMSPFTRNCTRLNVYGAAASEIQEIKASHSCLLLDELEKLDTNFHPKDLNCSHYRRVYRRSLDDVEYKEVGLGTRISFDIPDHVPDVCKECQKPNGNCGVGLRCIFHAKECKDKVISLAGSMNHPIGNVLFSLFSFAILMVLWTQYQCKEI